MQGPLLYCPALRTLRAQLTLVFAPSQGQGTGSMEGLLGMEEVLQGSFLRPQLERLYEELHDAAMDVRLQVCLL